MNRRNFFKACLNATAGLAFMGAVTKLDLADKIIGVLDDCFYSFVSYDEKFNSLVKTIKCEFMDKEISICTLLHSPEYEFTKFDEQSAKLMLIQTMDKMNNEAV